MSGQPNRPDKNGAPEPVAPEVPATNGPAVAAEPDRPPSQPEAAASEGRIAELESQVADLTDRLLRAHAELDNIRKRAERDKAETAKYAISRFARDIVGVSDNFQRAIAAVPPGAASQDQALKSLIEGVSMSEREFLKVLERHGVKRIDPTGEIFNPHLHQAVMEQPNPELPSGTVLQVLQAGYSIEDRMLRPAMVVVAKGGGKPVKPAEARARAANDDTRAEPTGPLSEPPPSTSAPDSDSQPA
jgi:molecular chaperone GrpE